MKESTFQRKAIAYLRSAGSYVFNVPGTGMEQKGTPDLLVCHRGLFIAAELKVPGEKPTKLQQYELEKVRTAGGTAAVIESMEALEALLNGRLRIES